MNLSAINERFGCSFENILNSKIWYLTIPITAVTVCQSALVIFLIWKTTVLHTNVNILVASSTVNGIIISMVYDVALILYSYANSTLRGMMFCIAIGTILISVTHFGIIAIDRYIYIAHPFYYMKHMTRKLIFKIHLAVWIIGLLYMAFPMLAYKDDKYFNNCFTLKLKYYCAGSAGYLANIIIVFFCYLRIAFLAFQHKLAANARRQQFDDHENVLVIKNTCKAAFRSVKFFVIMFGIFCSLHTSTNSNSRIEYILQFS